MSTFEDNVDCPGEISTDAGFEYVAGCTEVNRSADELHVFVYGQKDDFGGAAIDPQAPCHFESIHVAKGDIQNYKIGVKRAHTFEDCLTIAHSACNFVGMQHLDQGLQ